MSLSSSCSCPPGYSGPRCQQTTRSFSKDGWAWYAPLEMCDVSHLSLEFITKHSEGTLLYNGPIVAPEPEETIVSDFLSLELERGHPRLLMDFGSGTLELKVKTKKTLDDGEWHRIDIFWDNENVRLVVDYCKSALVTESDDPTVVPAFDPITCQASGTIPPFNEYLNVNAPLQLGGKFTEEFDPAQYSWGHVPGGQSFIGCIKNVFHNSKLYDLANPGLHKNSVAGCPATEAVCNAHSRLHCYPEHGVCVGSLHTAKCQCLPGWSGSGCMTPTASVTFKPQSYIKYALSFEPDKYMTQLQLRFRTREEYGELFRMSDQHNREYAILEIKDSRLRFRYNLNNLKTDERDIWLNAVPVNDGQWHFIKVSRYGSSAMLELDGGEGRRYNETTSFTGHQWLAVDKQEGVFAGGKAEYTGVRTFEVIADFQKGCMDDVRVEGKFLPLPPAQNGTQWGQATMARNVEKGCPSNKPCTNVLCPEPFECVDLWNEFECTCGEGRVVTTDGKGCTDKDECLENPCRNGGFCINQDPRTKYRCVCLDNFWGENCELIQEGRTLKLGMGALAAILVCLLMILILVLVFVVYSRRREAHIKYPGPDDDVRENIINYDDEGGGEDDMTAFDITPLQIPIGGPHPEMNNKIPFGLGPMPMGVEPNVGIFIEEHKKRADGDPNAPPFDDLRNYAYEGGGSTAGSLSSLASGTDDEEQEFDYLGAWGPRFDKLADMYGQEPESDLEEEEEEEEDV